MATPPRFVREILPALRVAGRFVAPSDPRLDRVASPGAALVIEPTGHPRVVDIAAVARSARAGLALIVDNTFATDPPAPLALGAAS
jgi:cystathionine beta-lyase/cystathionine gamma-synthase